MAAFFFLLIYSNRCTCKFCRTLDFHLRYNHCKLQLSQVLFSSIFWLFVVWLICILKQHLRIRNYWLGHANRSSPYTSALQSKTCIGCMGSEQNQNRRIVTAYEGAENCKTTMSFSWRTLHPVRGNLHATLLSNVTGTDLVCTLTNKTVLISAQFFFFFFFAIVQSATLAAKLYKTWKILQIWLYLATLLTLGEMAKYDRTISCAGVARSWACLYPLHWKIQKRVVLPFLKF